MTFRFLGHPTQTHVPFQNSNRSDSHDDRDIEFIQFKRWILKSIQPDGTLQNLITRACEMMSDDLYVADNKEIPR